MAIVLPKLSRFRPSVSAGRDVPLGLSVELCRPDARYVAGQWLRATWRVSRGLARDATGVEASVLWYTEGKGDEDLQVHHFVRWNEAQLGRMTLSDRQPIQCRLPLSPISYDGTLLRICWCVRIRLFRAGGQESVSQQPFRVTYSAVPSDNQPPVKVISDGATDDSADPLDRQTVLNGALAESSIAPLATSHPTAGHLTS